MVEFVISIFIFSSANLFENRCNLQSVLDLLNLQGSPGFNVKKTGFLDVQTIFFKNKNKTMKA